MKRCRLRLGKDGDFLDVSVTPDYVHFHLVSPGRQFGVQDVYLPRRHVVPLLRWLGTSIRAIPPRKAKKQAYPPDLIRQALKSEALWEAGMRASKKSRGRVQAGLDSRKLKSLIADDLRHPEK